MVIKKENDLLPCPLCGSKDVAEWGIAKTSYSDKICGQKEFIVGCGQCGCRVGTIGGKQEAHDRWNKRIK